MRLLLIAVALAIFGSAVPQRAAAVVDHPLHSTRSTIEFNAETGCFEVALCVFPDDLSKALSERAGHRIDVEDDKELDEQLKAYVTEEFQIRLGDGKPKKLEWIGHELQTQQCWLYFEFLVDADVPTEIGVKNSVLMDQFEDQINIAYVRVAGRQRCMTFRTDLPDWQEWNLSRANKIAPIISAKTTDASR